MLRKNKKNNQLETDASPVALQKYSTSNGTEVQVDRSGKENQGFELSDTVSPLTIDSVNGSIDPNDEHHSSDHSDNVMDEHMPSLVLSKYEKIPLRNFESDVRARMDLQKFSKEAVILLDESSTNIEEIIEIMIRKTFEMEKQYPRVSEINAEDETEKPPAKTQARLSLRNASVKIDDLQELEEIEMKKRIEEAKEAIFIQFPSQSFNYTKLAKTITSISINDREGLTTDQSWICVICSLASITQRHVAIARLRHPINLNQSNQCLHFVILVLTPTKEKGTKKDIELSRTFATMFADINFRQTLMDAHDREGVIACMDARAEQLTEQHTRERKHSLTHADIFEQTFQYERKWPVCNGIRTDLKNRLPIYHTDFLDAFRDCKSFRKVISATTFLFFVCLLPSIAFGALNEHNTKGELDVQMVIISQTFGGMCFALFAGQPLVILLTTAPLAIYTKVIYTISKENDFDFKAMFGWVGVFNAFYLTIYSICDLSRFMKWSTRSTEETFAFFISIAFFVDAGKDISKVFKKHYTFQDSTCNLSNATDVLVPEYVTDSCQKETSLLFVLLIIGTVWLSVSLFNITKTPYLNSSKRELVSDFALPVAVLVMSFIGSFCFQKIQMDGFNARSASTFQLKSVPFLELRWQGIVAALGLAFPLSLLFFMDQNISGAMVNTPTNKLKKPGAYNWDILVVAMINLVLSVFGMPWVHGALPHSPLHVKALADTEDRVDMGHHVSGVVVRVRETRVTGVLAHILIGFSLFCFPIPIKFIPVAVLDGLFIYMAITALYGNQLFERMLLLIMEQTAYPPSHYLMRVPQRQVHLFTFLQFIQLACLCALGFAPSPYAKMGFPLLLIIQLPIRHLLLPKILPSKYLEALDKPI